MEKIFNHKKGFAMRYLPIAIALFSGIVLLAFVSYQYFGDNYGVQMVNTNSQSYKDVNQTMNDIIGISSSAYTNVSTGGGLTLVGTFNSIFQGTFKIIALGLQSIGLIKGTGGDVVKELGMPTVIASIATSLVFIVIVIVIVFGIISLLSRGRI